MCVPKFKPPDWFPFPLPYPRFSSAVEVGVDSSILILIDSAALLENLFEESKELRTSS